MKNDSDLDQKDNIKLGEWLNSGYILKVYFLAKGEE